MAGISGNWKSFHNKLIDLVRNKPILFNTRLREFRNNKLRENAWLAVSTEIDANGTYYSSRQNRFELGAKTRCVWVSVKYTVSHGLPHVACK